MVKRNELSVRVTGNRWRSASALRGYGVMQSRVKGGKVKGIVLIRGIFSPLKNFQLER